MIKTAKEFFRNNFEKSNCFIDFDTEGYKVIQKSMIEFAKLHVETALKQASKNATTIHDEKLLDEISKGLKSNDFIYKPSILNAYPLENIN